MRPMLCELRRGDVVDFEDEWRGTVELVEGTKVTLVREGAGPWTEESSYRPVADRWNREDCRELHDNNGLGFELVKTMPGEMLGWHPEPWQVTRGGEVIWSDPL